MSGGSYLGKYRGTVLNNIDPEFRGRLMCIVPDVYGLVPSTWCEACTRNWRQDATRRRTLYRRFRIRWWIGW